ncbi:sensor histidine kinase, partial [Planctomycetota bacterium]
HRKHSAPAHEMNTPMGFITSNFQTLQKYTGHLQALISGYEKFTQLVDPEHSDYLASSLAEVTALRKKLNIDFVLEDLSGLFTESKEGLERVTNIIQNLRDFSRIDQAENFDEYQINNGLDATLIIAQNEFKGEIEIVKDLGDIPPVPCNAGQLNQVLLAIVVNAAQAIGQQDSSCEAGSIRIRTYATNSQVCCEISDNGPGIPQDKLSRIFEPFFTTKPAGEGTGLGLSAAYDIVVNKHHGQLLVDSVVGQGTTFTMRLPRYPQESKT